MAARSLWIEFRVFDSFGVHNYNQTTFSRVDFRRAAAFPEVAVVTRRLKVRKARLGDSVLLKYRGYLPDGTEFCRNTESEGLSCVLGERKLFPAVEDALIGLEPGEQTEVVLQPADAYGQYSSRMIYTLSRNEIPDGLEVLRGTSLKLQNGEGRAFDAVVTSVNRRNIVADANHPLAGRVLRYELELCDFLASR